jgi:hypothetical protein
MKHSLGIDGQDCVLHVSGELDALSSTELRPIIDRVVQGGWRSVRVTCSCR